MATRAADPNHDDDTTPEVDGRARISASAGSSQGWFRAYRTADAMELLRSDRNAFCLLYLIAVRARWNQAAPNWHSLALGEALVGDHNALGMSREQYRAALGRLVRYGLVATIRTTSKGTVVKLCSNGIFDPTRDADNHQNPQLTPTQPPPNPHLTPTKKNGKKEEGKEGEEEIQAPAPAAPARKRATRFQIPTIEEIRAYAVASKIGSPDDPEAFIDHYKGNGWRVGRNPMRDWQATFRSWIRRKPAMAGLRPRQADAATARPAPADGDKPKTPSLLKDLWK